MLWRSAPARRLHAAQTTSLDVSVPAPPQLTITVKAEAAPISS